MAHQQKLDDYYCDTISFDATTVVQSDSYRDTPPNQQIHQYGAIQPLSTNVSSRPQPIQPESNNDCTTYRDDESLDHRRETVVMQNTIR